jgi:large subunit ribosomal protein L29
MKISEWRKFSEPELRDKLKSLKEEIFYARYRNLSNQEENKLKLRSLRRDIARVKTLLREIEIKKEKK